MLKKIDLGNVKLPIVMLNWNQIALNDDNSGGYLLSQVFLEPDKQRRDVEKRIKKRIINGLKELCHPQ